MELAEECRCGGGRRFLQGGGAALVPLRSRVPVMTAIIRKEDRAQIEHKGKKIKKAVLVGAKESIRSRVWKAAAPCEFNLNQETAVH